MQLLELVVMVADYREVMGLMCLLLKAVVVHSLLGEWQVLEL